MYGSFKIKLDILDVVLFFENLNLLKLLNEVSEKCEGKIIMEEC